MVRSVSHPAAVRPVDGHATFHRGPAVTGARVRVAGAAGWISRHHLGRSAVEFRQEIVVLIESA